jgi:hypothetical protein
MLHFSLRAFTRVNETSLVHPGERRPASLFTRVNSARFVHPGELARFVHPGELNEVNEKERRSRAHARDARPARRMDAKLGTLPGTKNQKTE